ncbi:MAG: succinylglutamate desuccinylase/aspartoacylase family protein [Natronospirillum sp.]
MSIRRVPLPAPAPGHERFLTVHEFGTGEHFAYIQAGLHADEWPGLLVVQHLLEKLAVLEAAGNIRQAIRVVPYANPVGMNQRIFGTVPGRFDMVTGQNFNRGMAVSAKALVERVTPNLTDDVAYNDRVVRTELRALVAEKTAEYEIQTLHKALLNESIDATVMLDLHCDLGAIPYLFYGKHQVEQGQALATCLGFPLSVEEDVRGTVAFDGTHTQPWVVLEDAVGARFDRPCFAATLELRGSHDVNDALAQRDAEGILAFLEHQGFVADSGARAQPMEGEAERFDVEQVQLVASPENGILVHLKHLGTRLAQGEHFADIVLVDRDQPERVAVRAPVSGLLFNLSHTYLAHVGATIAMIAADEAVGEPGAQLSM